MAARRLTELEGAVLGVLWQNAPCTAYRVRRVFLDSPSPFWSGSAGAIYPLLARLEARGLIAAREGQRGRRASRLHAPTASGRLALRAWLEPPWSAIVTGVPSDPLRTRVSFFGALRPAERTRFLRTAIRAIAADIRAHESVLAGGRYDDQPFEAAVARGALAALRARRAWLQQSLRRFGPRRTRKPRR